MGPAIARNRRPLLESLAGVEAGVLAGVVMLGWFMLHSIWGGDPWWAVPNLLASTFYGQRALYMGGGTVTVSGAALHLLVSGVIGALFALAVTPWRANHSRMALLGLFVGLVWYYLSYGYLWHKINPLVPVYSAVPSMLTGHLLFGICLSLYPRWLARIEREPMVHSIREAVSEVPHGVPDLQNAEAPGVHQHNGPGGNGAQQERDQGGHDPGLGDAHHSRSLGE